MSTPPQAFAEGDRVRAPRRTHFPDGTILKRMELGYLLVKWDGDVLETAHHTELIKVIAHGLGR
jgi:hypothetical protein